MTLVGNMPRFFVDSVSGNTISIRGNDAYHIGRSLRMRLGDIITVCADRVEYRAKILSISDKEVVCDVLSAEKSENEPTVNVVLYQALPKSDKMDLIVQKAVELGADEIRPFVGRNTVAEADFKKIERFNRIAKEASKQCGRAFVTEVKEAVRLRELPRFFGDFDLVLLCNEHESQKTLSDALDGRLQLTRVAVIVGSEGGFETEEINLLVDAGAVSVSLGRRVLRAETAGLYALSVLNERLNNRKI